MARNKLRISRYREMLACNRTVRMRYHFHKGCCTYCNLLLHVIMTHNQLRIDKNIRREKERSDSRVCQLNCAVMWEERCHKAKQYHRPQRTEQVWHPRGEIILGLAGEKSQANEEPRGYQNSLEDKSGLVEGHDHGDGVCLETCETGQEKEIGRIGLPFPIRE